MLTISLDNFTQGLAGVLPRYILYKMKAFDFARFWFKFKGFKRLLIHKNLSFHFHRNIILPKAENCNSFLKKFPSFSYAKFVNWGSCFMPNQICRHFNFLCSNFRIISPQAPFFSSHSWRAFRTFSKFFSPKFALLHFIHTSITENLIFSAKIVLQSKIYSQDNLVWHI